MLTIRPEQAAAISTDRLIKANRKLVIYAKQRFPKVFLAQNDSETLKFVEDVRAAAKNYGIEKEDDVATFLDFSVMYGDDFPQAPWCEDILACDALHGPDKMAVLRYRVRETGVTL